jgi:hypothetical protein
MGRGLIIGRAGREKKKPRDSNLLGLNEEGVEGLGTVSKPSKRRANEYIVPWQTGLNDHRLKPEGLRSN